MKPGDRVWAFGETVWFLLDDKITKGLFHDIPHRGGDYLAHVMYRDLNAAGQVVAKSHVCLSRLLFPTREALCEHYRKIFE